MSKQYKKGWKSSDKNIQIYYIAGFVLIYTKPAMFLYHLFVVATPLYSNNTCQTYVSITPKPTPDLSETDILSGCQTCRPHWEKRFPLVEKIISDIF